MRKYNLRYDSLTELIEKAHLKPSALNANLSTFKIFKNDVESYNPIKWYGIEEGKPSQVIRAIKSGYRPGLDAIRDAAGQFEIPPIKCVRRQKVRGSQGDDLDMARVYSGHLDSAWGTTKKSFDGSAYGKNITIAVDIGANMGVSADKMIWRGAYAAALADKYAEAGYSVELYAFCVVRKVTLKDDSAEVIVKLLDSAEPYDLEKLANTICFPGFFRTLIFEALLTIPDKIKDSLGIHTPELPEFLDGAILIKDIWSIEDVKKQKPVNTED